MDDDELLLLQRIATNSIEHVSINWALHHDPCTLPVNIDEVGQFAVCFIVNSVKGPGTFDAWTIWGSLLLPVQALLA